MKRIFKEHSFRNTIDLCGEWEFCLDPDNKGEAEQWYKNFPSDFRYINVPQCWNTELDLYQYFGTAWYRTEIETEACLLHLTFGAVSGLCKVYLDGEFLGEHYGGWTAFSFDKSVAAGVHTLVLSVDASSNKLNTIPLQKVDWYHYGGIIRSVEATQFTSPYIAGHRAAYKLNDAMDTATLSLSFKMVHPEGKAFATNVSLFVEGEKVAEQRVQVGTDGEVVLGEVTLGNIELWEIGRGKLYEVRLVTDSDDVYDRIGFRKIEVKDTQIFLNGKSIFIKGVNRHEHHPDWGFAVPFNLSKRDVAIIKDLNCNMVRGSHYPNSHAFLDLLDREGILFWSEIPMWGFPAEALADEVTERRACQMHREMIEQYYNHPCIVMWGLHNEVATHTEEGYALTKTLNALVRSLDDSRLITFASDKFLKGDKCTEFADVVSLNYYFGWYSGGVEQWEQFVKGLRGMLQERGCGDKPILMSEFGAAALYGYSSFNHDRWTMQYQSDMLEKVITLCDKEDGVCGTLVWQFCDINSDMEVNRARSFNNKGILDEYRRPKMAYDTVKKLYKGL